MVNVGYSTIDYFCRTLTIDHSRLTMNIGFDGKRAYHNHTGLGHYSRTLIHSLAEYYPQHHYFLFNPQSSSLFRFDEQNVHEVLPRKFPATFFRSAWRSSWVKRDLQKLNIDL